MIRKTITVGSVYDNTYLKYTVKVYFTNTGNSVRLYRGKTLVVGGKTTLDLTEVVRDYVWQEDKKWNEDRNGFEPKRVWGTPMVLRDNVEKDKELVNVMLQIVLQEDTLNADTVATVYVPVQRFKVGEADPYRLASDSFINYSQSTLVNHIPYLLTNNLWLGLAYCVTSSTTEGGESTCVGVVTNRDGDGLKLDNGEQWWGNYVYVIPLSDVFGAVVSGESDNITVYYGSEVSDRLLGGTATEVAVDGYNVIGADVNKYTGLYGRNRLYLDVQKKNGKDWTVEEGGLLTIIDECPSKYYVQWVDSNGWHSQAVTAEEVISVDREVVTGVYNVKDVVNESVTLRWRCKSKKANREELEAWKRIVTARYVWLYDSTKDTVYCTTVKDTEKGFEKGFCTFELESVKIEG